MQGAVTLDDSGELLTISSEKVSLVLNPDSRQKGYHNFMDSKIAGVTSATASAAPPEFGHCNASELSHFQTVGIDEVFHAILKSPSKECSSDQLPTWQLKECADTVASYFVNLFNLSLVGRHFPSPWKHAIITPLLKKAGLDHSNVSSYRPVSNLPHVSKILERIVNRQLITQLEQHKLVPDVQSAYRCG